MHILVIVRLGSAKVRDKLSPLLRVPSVRQVTLVRHAPIPLESPRLRQVIHSVGIDDSGPPRQPLASLRNVLACFVSGLRLTRCERPDALLAFNLTPYGLIAWAVGRLTGTPVLLSLIGVDFNRRLAAPVLGAALRRVLRSSAAVIIFGEDARQRLLADGLPPEQVYTLPNTVDTDTYRPDPSAAPDTDLIYVGNLHPFKRVDVILRALREVHRTRPQTTLRIVGDGPARASLEALADSLGVRPAVTFADWSNHIADDLRRSRLLLLLSEHEGLPAAVLEALCTGLPVIVTAVGAIPSVVQDGLNGWLLPLPTDPAQVAARILPLLDDPDHYQQMSRAALRARETHGYAQAAAVWETILSRRVSRARRD